MRRHLLRRGDSASPSNGGNNRIDTVNTRGSWPHVIIAGQSPSVEVLTEARLVVGGVLADGGDLDGAISLLAGAGAGKALRNPADRHVRQWYALGDLYERAGDLPRARELFERVAMADPEAYDVLERLDSLGPVRGRSRPPRSDSATRGGNDALRRSQ